MKKSAQFVFIVLLGLGLTGPVSGQSVTQQEQEKNQEKVQVKVQNQEKNQIIHGPRFVDKDGDGFNDNAPDHDNDGIPNGQDPDYQGAGKAKRPVFVDKDGDGIADNLTRGQRQGYGKNKAGRGGYGPGDGSGNQGVRPQNGFGYGPGAASGNCDGTGPKGKGARKGSR